MQYYVSVYISLHQVPKKLNTTLNGFSYSCGSPIQDLDKDNTIPLEPANHQVPDEG